MRKTLATKTVSALLKEVAKPMTLEEIHGKVVQRLPKTAYSTTYRVLCRLEDEAKINRVDWRERGSRFEWAGLPHHHHIVCQSCGETTDLSDRDMSFDEQKVTKSTGFTISHHTIELEGICPDCQD